MTLRTAVVGNKWAALALPLLLLLGIAAWIVYSIIEEQSENVDDSVSRSTLLHTRGDAKAREVGPMPGAAPTTQPAPALDEELQLPAAPPK